jgi:hypothetical protein
VLLPSTAGSVASASSDDSLCELETLKQLISTAKRAQKLYSKFSQAQVRSMCQSVQLSSCSWWWGACPILRRSPLVNLLLLLLIMLYTLYFRWMPSSRRPHLQQVLRGAWCCRRCSASFELGQAVLRTWHVVPGSRQQMLGFAQERCIAYELNKQLLIHQISPACRELIKLVALCLQDQAGSGSSGGHRCACAAVATMLKCP